MKYLAVLVLLFPSCSLFTDDATPALEASRAREAIFRNQAAAFRGLVERATGVDEATKTKILAGLGKDVEDYTKLAVSMNSWIAELGSVDYVKIATELLDEWRKQR